MLLYSPAAEALRALLRDHLNWDHVDAGEGWLIFNLPPAELGIHPAEAPRHELSLICDDLETTVAELIARGVVFKGEPTDEGWGVVTTMVLPGDVEMMLYQPRHPTAI